MIETVTLVTPTTFITVKVTEIDDITPIQDAFITVMQEGMIKEVTTTNSQGTYILNLTIGTYTIIFRRLGYEIEKKVIVLTNQPRKIYDLALNPKF